MPDWFPALYQWTTYIFSVQIADGGIFGTLGGWIPVMLVLAFGARVIDSILNS